MPDIREAGYDDLPTLLAWGEAFLSFHPLMADLPKDMASIEAALRNLIDNPDACLLMHNHGMIGGVVVPIWACPSQRIASELFWWAEEDGVALLDAFEAWAGEQGAEMIQMLKIHGVRDVAPLYQRRGYAPMESVYMRAV